MWHPERLRYRRRLMIEAQQSDALKKLVIFIIVVAIIATIVALVWYFTKELPIQQAAMYAPMNIEKESTLH